MTLKKPSFRFSWYHRDELQVVVIVVLLVLFFSRSEILSTFTLALIVASIAALYLFRFVRRTLLENTHTRLAAAWIRRVESRILFTSHERSRIAMTVLCCVVLGILCVHRVVLALMLPRFESPSEIYWILFLAWYWVVVIFVLGYLVFRAVRGGEHDGRKRSPFFEGLVASLFFYHGLPAKQRMITFSAAFILGGVPTYMVTRLYPYDASAYALAALLVIPVIILTLGGAWYATRWHIP